MPGGLVIVDESDPDVRYAGTWTVTGADLEYAHTTHCTGTAGATATFTFVGTSISVYGTVGNNASAAALSFVLDTKSSQSFTAPPEAVAVHHARLYESGTLANGPHTLVVTQTVADPARCLLFLDYFTYETTTGTTPPAGGPDTGIRQPYFVDDRDPGIVYAPAWTDYGSELDFMHTSRASSAAAAKLTYTFEGRGISYYGGITQGSRTNASMSIDGGPATFFVPSTAPGMVQNNALYYNSGVLSDGRHTLVVTAMNENPIWLDYFLVVPPLAGGPGASSASASGSAVPGGATAPAPGQSGSTALPGSGNTNNSNNNNSSHGSQSNTNVGAIAGGVIGGVFLIACLAFSALFFCRRRRRREDEGSVRPDMSHYQSSVRPASTYGAGPGSPPPGITPFPVPYAHHADSPPRQQSVPELLPYTLYPYIAPYESASALSATGTAPTYHPGHAQSPSFASERGPGPEDDMQLAYAGMVPSTSNSESQQPARSQVARKLAHEARFQGATSRGDGDIDEGHPADGAHDQDDAVQHSERGSDTASGPPRYIE